MPIREATPKDLDAIMAIVQAGKAIMAASGNPSQWKGDYPDRAQFLSDMERGECYVLEEGQIPQAVFVLAIGEEPYYAVIQGALLCGHPGRQLAQRSALRHHP